MKKKFLYSGITILLVIGIITLVFPIIRLRNLLRPTINTFEFVSKTNHTLVVEEYNSMFSTSLTFYRKYESFEVEKTGSLIEITSYSIGDYLPFSEGNYEVLWDNSLVTVKYYKNINDEPNSVVIDLETRKVIKKEIKK